MSGSGDKTVRIAKNKNFGRSCGEIKFMPAAFLHRGALEAGKSYRELISREKNRGGRNLPSLSFPSRKFFKEGSLSFECTLSRAVEQES